MSNYEHIKIVATGHVIEVYEMEKAPVNPHDILKDKWDRYSEHLQDKHIMSLNPLVREKRLAEIRKELKLDYENRMEDKADRQEERRAQTLRDARNRVRRYALANFDSNDSFITLTYAENFQDVGQADKDYKEFIRKFKKYTGLNSELKYLAVREFQKRGAIHFHFVTNWKHPSRHVDNEEYIKKLERIVADIWSHGYVDIKPLNKAKSKNKKYNGKPVDNIGAYISKYMSKEYDDSRLKGKKAYLISRGMEKPMEYTGEEAIRIIEAYQLDIKKETFTNSYESEYLGNITYKEYNMKRMENK